MLVIPLCIISANRIIFLHSLLLVIFFFCCLRQPFHVLSMYWDQSVTIFSVLPGKLLKPPVIILGFILYTVPLSFLLSPPRASCQVTASYVAIMDHRLPVVLCLPWVVVLHEMVILMVLYSFIMPATGFPVMHAGLSVPVIQFTEIYCY